MFLAVVGGLFVFAVVFGTHNQQVAAFTGMWNIWNLLGALLKALVVGVAKLFVFVYDFFPSIAIVGILGYLFLLR